MEVPSFGDLSRSVIESLESVSHSTEAVYGRMGTGYPLMVRELDTSFQVNGSQELLLTLIEAILQGIEARKDQSLGFQEESRKMLVRWQEQMGAIGTLGTTVDEIREDSILMELLSLNAMVIAAKAGEAGRAFACITSELKQLSNQTMGLTDGIAQKEGALGQIFTEFASEWEKCEKDEVRNLEAFLTQVTEMFHTLRTRMTEVLEGMEKIYAKAAAVKAPLVRIMVEIQNQDRIRQGIDHVLVTLREFLGHPENASLDARLDDLCYLEILPDLSVQVLDEILDQIQKNRLVFHQSLTQAKDLIGRLEHERVDFLDQEFLSARSGETLQGTVARGEQIFTLFIGETNGVLRAREGLVRKGSQLRKNVADMVESLQQFDTLISRFRNIDLASRIQVARQSQLSAMRDNASSMTDLTKKIELDVHRSAASASAFSEAVQVVFQDYQDQFTDRYHSAEQFIETGRQSIGHLKQVEEDLVATVKGARLFTTAFTDQFAHTQVDLESLDKLVETVIAQKANLGAIKTQIQSLKKDLLARRGVSEWKLEKEKLKAMVDGFTIFTHKKFAADLGDFEVEQAAESGEVTLF